jgi:DNA polymerase elongation subunit (family B)
MVSLYLDIETIPAQDPEVRAKIAENVTPPARMSKAETIAAWEANDKPAAVEEAIAKTALDGTYGHVCCIGWAVDDGPVMWTSTPAYSEAAAIERFIIEADKAVPAYRNPTIIGHNVINFDIRFLWQRAIILGVRMPGWFPRDPKPWGGEVFDTMTAWAGQRGMIGMDRLCEALGIEGKGEIDGSMVGKLWAEGRHQEIAEYCRADVERTRAIHRKMQIAFGEVQLQEAAE